MLHSIIDLASYVSGSMLLKFELKNIFISYISSVISVLGGIERT